MAEPKTMEQIVNSLVISLLLVSIWILATANADLFEDSTDSFEFTYLDNDEDNDISPGDSVTLVGGFDKSVGTTAFVFQMQAIGGFLLIFCVSMIYQRFDISQKDE
ncbi:MAG: hypothetical protein QF365_06080 [Candidatus Thalassarchaeaceae archaeon]|jgi:hypothetical protein|nr:hypothetical protein [Candidatus Thalassarchaeaceae archaeon]